MWPRFLPFAPLHHHQGPPAVKATEQMQDFTVALIKQRKSTSHGRGLNGGRKRRVEVGSGEKARGENLGPDGVSSRLLPRVASLEGKEEHDGA